MVRLDRRNNVRKCGGGRRTVICLYEPLGKAYGAQCYYRQMMYENPFQWPFVLITQIITVLSFVFLMT